METIFLSEALVGGLHQTRALTPAATFTYNGGNELTAATGVTPTGAALAGTGFSYDGNGNQTSAKSQIGLSTTYNAQEAASAFTPVGGSAIAQSYASADGGNGERTKSGTGSSATTFAVSPLSPAPAWSTTGTTSQWTVRDPDGRLIAVRIGTSATSATELYPFTDNVASVRAMVKADGTVADTYSYSAYGSTLSASEATGLGQPYRYGGGYTDTATGLVKLGVRYYDPTQSRFTQQDPIGRDPQYIYAQGCPSTYNDPSGGASSVGTYVKGCLKGAAEGGALGLAGGAIAGSIAPGAGTVTGAVAGGARGAAEGCATSVATTAAGDLFGSTGKKVAETVFGIKGAKGSAKTLDDLGTLVSRYLDS